MSAALELLMFPYKLLKQNLYVQWIEGAAISNIYRCKLYANAALGSCFKTPQLARYGVINRFEMLIDSFVNCAFSSIDALSNTHLREF